MEQLLWEDCFLSEQLDGTRWNARTGNWVVDAQGQPIVSGWGNNELQYYTASSRNLFIKEQRLCLCARKEPAPVQFGTQCAYTSARIDTKDKFSFRYGRIAVRARCSTGTGLWPAVWLMPQHSVYGPWATSGEIDLWEGKGRLPYCAYGTLHYGGPPQTKTLQEYSGLLKSPMSEFHTYELIWQPEKFTWKVDGVPYATSTPWQEKNCLPFPQPFDQEFYVIINLAVGGWFDTEANGAVSATFPAQLEVDYIRVYQ